MPNSNLSAKSELLAGVLVAVVSRANYLVALKYHAIERSAFWLSQSTVNVNVFLAPAKIKYKMRCK